MVYQFTMTVDVTCLTNGRKLLPRTYVLLFYKAGSLSMFR